MKNKIEKTDLSDEFILSKIYLIGGQKVMLDRDLSVLYGVETRMLNQAVKRNLDRFPADFMFQLTKQEFENWKSQNVISNSVKMGIRKMPYAFTEHGVLMLSNVLNSVKAIQVSIQIIRLFNKMREMISTNKTILKKLEALEKSDFYQSKQIEKIFKIIKELLKPKLSKRKMIGFVRHD